MMLNPWSEIRRLRAELAATEALLAEANAKLAAGGRARGAKQRARVIAMADRIRDEIAPLRDRQGRRG